MGEEESDRNWGSPHRGVAAEESAELRSRLERIVTNKAEHAFGVPGAVFGIAAPDGTMLIEALGVDGAGVEVASKSFMPMLSHTSGLPIDLRHELSDPPGTFRFREGSRWPNEAAEACLLEAPRYKPGASVQYSNVAFGLLGLAADRVTGRPFTETITEYVFQPLGIEAFVGEPPPGI